jgi:hypothetical protein
VAIGQQFSCPMLYTWDGQELAFESDMYTSGTLGLKLATAYRKPDPNDSYVLRQPIDATSGTIDFRLVEEMDELDYLDSAQLYAVDVPSNLQVVAWANNVPGGTLTLDQRLVTIGLTPQPLVSAVNLATGEDVTAVLAASDGNVVTLGSDLNAPAWNTLQADLGDLSSASVIKLVVDGRSRYPNTAAGDAARLAADPNGWQTQLRVLDSTGAWTQVPRNLVTMVRPKEFPRRMAIDITNVFLTSTYQIQMSWVNMTELDAIWIDTTPNEVLTITEAPLVSATLDYHGFSYSTGGNFPLFTYAQPGSSSWGFPPGSYTAYGDVTPLLGAVDDMFVIYATGDEIALSFQPVPPADAGLTRFYTFASVGYYKQVNLVNGGAVPFTVDPLPFAAMSNFPYDPTVEQYPTDAAHQAYLATWNTRVEP